MPVTLMWTRISVRSFPLILHRNEISYMLFHHISDNISDSNVFFNVGDDIGTWLAIFLQCLIVKAKF